MANDNDRYDELVRAGQERTERESRNAQAERERGHLFDQVAFVRRNSLFLAITTLGKALHDKYHERLGQIFCESYGDTVKINKSQLPRSGSELVVWDRDNRRVYCGSSGLAYSLVLNDAGTSVDIKDGATFLTDEEIATAIFDIFMPRVT